MKTADILTLVQIAITIPIAFYVAMAGRTFSLLQGERDVRSAWMAFDLAVLDNPPILAIIDHRWHHPSSTPLDEPLEQANWRWVCYAIRNPLENFYMAIGRRHRYWWSAPMCRDRAFYSLFSCLDPLVEDTQFMEIVAGFSADPRFADLCTAIKAGRRCDARDTSSAQPSAPVRRIPRNHACDQPNGYYHRATERRRTRPDSSMQRSKPS